MEEVMLAINPMGINSIGRSGKKMVTGDKNSERNIHFNVEWNHQPTITKKSATGCNRKTMSMPIPMIEGSKMEQENQMTVLKKYGKAAKSKNVHAAANQTKNRPIL